MRPHFLGNVIPAGFALVAASVFALRAWDFHHGPLSEKGFDTCVWGSLSELRDYDEKHREYPRVAPDSTCLAKQAPEYRIAYLTAEQNQQSHFLLLAFHSKHDYYFVTSAKENQLSPLF